MLGLKWIHVGKCDLVSTAFSPAEWLLNMAYKHYITEITQIDDTKILTVYWGLIAFDLFKS